ncbi:DEAD/DEAH box helicase family protein [Streptomyces ardesiacus]|uniref:DEAD/DEAH box helicase family protein n=1 Tax=Streptomyces ardesiacus TaxID=285564 RepID=UPI00365E1D66
MAVTAATQQPGGEDAQETKGIHASNNIYSTLLQAGRDINLHEQAPLSTERVAQAEHDAIGRAWLSVDEEGNEITTAPRVLSLLENGERVVVIAGPPGTGKTAAGLRALSELRPALPGGSGRVRLRLEHVLPDWDDIEKDKFLLPVGHGRGYLLDVSGQSANWAAPESVAKKLLGHARNLELKGSYLVLVAGDFGWPENDPVLGRNVVRVVGAPPGPLVARRHIEELYPKVVERGWLRETGREEGNKPAEGSGGDSDTEVSLADLLRADMRPADAAALALEVNRICVAGGSLKDARDAAQRWRDRVSHVFRDTRESADDRALLLAAVMLEGLSPSQVLAGARLLLGDTDAQGIREILAGRDLASRLEAIEAKSDGQRVVFSHLPGFPIAVLRHFWRQLSDVQPKLIEWVQRLTEVKGPGAARILPIADMLAQLAVEEGDLLPLDVAQTWATSGVAGREAASRLLTRVAKDPVLGQEARTRLRNWASRGSTGNATVAAVVCQGSFSTEYPRQALTCLRWVLGRGDHGDAVSAAEGAVRIMGSDTALLPRVWSTVNAWISEYANPEDRNRLAAGRAVLALLTPDDEHPAATLLLANALTHMKTTDELVDGWCTALSLPQLEGACERVLSAWADAVAVGALDGDVVVEVLNRVIREHWMTGPLSTFIAGRAGTDFTPQSVVDLRERLILRWNETPHEEQTTGETDTRRLWEPDASALGDAGPAVSTERGA